MMNKTIIFKYSFVFLFYIISCVGPPEPDHGLVENLPVVINTNSAFSYSLRGDDYSIDESFDISLSLTDGTLASTLIVTDYKNNDTTIVLLQDANGEDIYKYIISGNITRSDANTRIKPKKAIIQSNSFTGILSWTVTEQ
jgi:hypothetical protein